MEFWVSLFFGLLAGTVHYLGGYGCPMKRYAKSKCDVLGDFRTQN